MSTPIRPVIIDLIMLASFVKMMQLNMKMSKNYFRYIYNPNIQNNMTLLYILIYTVYIIGIKPTRYTNILKIIYKLFGVFTKLLSDKNDIIMYSMVLNMFITLFIILISKYKRLTKNVMIVLGGLTIIQILCRIVWGYNLINKRIIGSLNYKQKQENLEATDILIDKTANQDFDKLYDILKKAGANIGTLAKLSPEKRNAYIIQELLKVDLSKLNLSDQAITQIQTQFNMEKDELQKYINNLNTKINSLSKYQQKTNQLLSCVKKYS